MEQQSSYMSTPDPLLRQITSARTVQSMYALNAGIQAFTGPAAPLPLSSPACASLIGTQVWPRPALAQSNPVPQSYSLKRVYTSTEYIPAAISMYVYLDSARLDHDRPRPSRISTSPSSENTNSHPSPEQHMQTTSTE